MTAALTCTVLAGAATMFGGLLALNRRIRSDTGLAMALAFAAGAMVLVSIAEIGPKGATHLGVALGGGAAWAATVLLAAVGACSVSFLGRMSPGRADADRGRADPGRARLVRTGMVAAVAVTAHNVPEGLATFVSALEDPRAGAAVAVAIAVHNVPEGVAVAAPLYGSGSSRRLAFGAAGLSGLAEPVGALLGYAVLVALLPPAAFGVVFGVLSGVMVQISLSELVPTARRLAPERTVGVALGAGAATMTASLLLLRLV